ncbi:excalibur calcium-binding domain-containing protein [Kocuria dechangensis]|uniref:excalibur calcium-binding domain-containing protein n=1 Tax=Kocuria dechangensis TaxID=1176249 RepID=UPI00166C700F|nr:excalibur calcium-binding domain-containing protein [Kocuria dechangensis]
MKKSAAAGVALAAGVGLSALSMTPASAAFVFTDCSQAAGFGVYNIPAGSPSYSAALDDDADGVACESADWPFDPTRIPIETSPGVYEHHIYDWVPGAGPGSDQFSQVDQVPVGGADTGVTVEESSSVSGLALGGLALAAAAGTTLVVRRRGARA